MENLRLPLWAGFFIVVWLLAGQWSSDYATKTEQPTKATAQTQQNKPTAQTSKTALELSNSLPTLPDELSSRPSLVQERKQKLDLVVVTTDVMEVSINAKKGADIVQASLLNYYPDKKNKTQNIELLSYGDNSYHYLQTGLLSLDGQPEPNHQEAFVSNKARHAFIREQQETLRVSFRWQPKEEDTNIEVVKSYIFKRGRYDVQLVYEIKNKGSKDYPFVLYNRLVKKDIETERSMFDVETYSFNGPIVFNGESYEKKETENPEGPVVEAHTSGWAANIQHHFLVAAIPQQGEPFTYRVDADRPNNLYRVSMVGEQPSTLRPGQTTAVATTFFIGPKVQKQLRETAPGLELAVDYGRLTFLATPLFWLLEKAHGMVKNWGLAIIFVTFLIKLVFFPLTEASGKSMAKMRTVQPRLKALQERHKDNKQALSQATMELYKKEKVNPLAGCLPMLIQIPFFISFYWVLLESVEIRQAPFFLWIQDLSSRDPYFILPILMGLGMFFQQKLNPAPPDPMQAKIMTAMPIMFTGMFAFFPSGLVLYWLTNSLLSIAQQWRINRANT
jgi:YidC/Oxa1 family membrane protein insertase